MRYVIKVWGNDRSMVAELKNGVQLEALADMLSAQGMWVEAMATELSPCALEVALVPMEIHRWKGFVMS